MASRLAIGATILALSGAWTGTANAQVLQSPPDSGATLSLPDALKLAFHNNPTYRRAEESARAAGASVLAAYGGFLPQLSGSFGVGYQQGGSQLFDGTQLGASADLLTSNYSIGASFSLNGTTILNPAAARATHAAADADWVGQRQTLRTTVTDQYLAALAATAMASLQDTLLETAKTQLALATGKAKVGTGTQLDVQQAQVVVGQKQVARLQAHNQAAIERIKLYQQMGVDPPTGSGLRLTTTFTVDPLTLTLDSALAIARRDNPSLKATRAREHASDLNLAMSRSTYFPTLSVATGIGGFATQYTDPNFPVQQAVFGAQVAMASCDSAQALRAAVGLPSNPAACAVYTVTPAEAAAIRHNNAVFPFGFTPTPHAISATVSLPFFDGFNREANVERAVAARNSARYDTRDRALQLTTDVSTAYLTMRTAEETAGAQEQTAAQALTALHFIEQRYKVGLSTFVEVSVARDTYESAENSRITSIYDYFKALADLEGAVGRPLRASVDEP